MYEFVSDVVTPSAKNLHKYCSIVKCCIFNTVKVTFTITNFIIFFKDIIIVWLCF